MDIRDSQRIKEIRDNTRAMAEAFSCIASTLADALELYISTRTETQTETQDSNLTFEKDECAKEYEELGLKELKELIKADRKTENCSEKPNNCDKDINVRSKTEPRTCSVNGRPYSECTNCEHFRCTADEPQTETEIAKAIVHKMIDDSVIAEDAYPDLRQKMHDAVDGYVPQTDRPQK